MPQTGTRVVKLRRQGGKVVQGCDVYIGRRVRMGGWDLPQSKWANPFTVKNSGSSQEAARRYREYITQQPDIMASLHELDGKVLGCWCKEKPSDSCHGDILVDLLRAQKAKAAEQNAPAAPSARTSNSES